MSYVAGTSGMAHLGVPDDGPRVQCDAEGGCSMVVRMRPGRVPPMWFLDGRPPPGWKGTRHGPGLRRDFCPEHKSEAKP